MIYKYGIFNVQSLLAGINVLNEILSFLRGPPELDKLEDGIERHNLLRSKRIIEIINFFKGSNHCS